MAKVREINRFLNTPVEINLEDFRVIDSISGSTNYSLKTSKALRAAIIQEKDVKYKSIQRVQHLVNVSYTNSDSSLYLMHLYLPRYRLQRSARAGPLIMWWL